MTTKHEALEKLIQALAAKAEPLRELGDDDEAKKPLAGIIDEINALRAKQEKLGTPAIEVADTPPAGEGDPDAEAKSAAQFAEDQAAGKKAAAATRLAAARAAKKAKAGK